MKLITETGITINIEIGRDKKKMKSIIFNTKRLSKKELIELLARIGYKKKISFVRFRWHDRSSSFVWAFKRKLLIHAHFKRKSKHDFLKSKTQFFTS